MEFLIDIKDDDRALEKFNNTISYQEGRYFIAWPWKSDDTELPENFDVAFGRMKSLSRRLQADRERIILPSGLLFKLGYTLTG